MTPTPEQRIANLQCVIVVIVFWLFVAGFFVFREMNKLNREVGEIKTWVELQKEIKR